MSYSLVPVYSRQQMNVRPFVAPWRGGVPVATVPSHGRRIQYSGPPLVTLQPAVPGNVINASGLQRAAGAMNGNQLGQLQRDVASLAEAVGSMAQQLDTAFGNWPGGAVGSYDSVFGLGSGARRNGSLYKGGVGLTSSIETIADDAGAGVIATGNWTGDNLSRMTGTRACTIGFSTGASSANGGIVQTDSPFILVSFRINGEDVPQLQNVPLSRLLNTLEGDERRAPINIDIPYDVSVSWTATALNQLTGAAGETSFLFATVDAGDNCAF